jgi:hypothetical protein
MEEFASFTCGLHLFDDLSNETFIFSFFILFIENAVLFVTKSDTAEEMGNILSAKHRIIYFLSSKYGKGKCSMVILFSCDIFKT